MNTKIRLIGKTTITIIAMIIVHKLISKMGELMIGKTSGTFIIFNLIGWNVDNGTIISTSATGLVTVVGMIGISSILMEFVSFGNEVKK